MAMLLFMVCAVLGGIILASATVAGGRVSNIAEADKRYYSVTSAAQLLAEELSRKEVLIERTKSYSEITDAAGVKVETPAGVALPASTYTSSTVESENQGGTFANFSYLAQAANYLLFGEDAATISNETKWGKTYSDVALEVDDEISTEVEIIQATKRDFQMQLNSESDAALCKVNCHSFVQTDGTLVVQIENADDSEDTYKLRLVMKPDYTETQFDETENSVPVSVGGVEEGTRFMTRKTATKTSTISWALSNIKKME